MRINHPNLINIKETTACPGDRKEVEKTCFHVTGLYYLKPMNRVTITVV